MSRSFYSELGFEEVPLSDDMSYFRFGELGFYLQNYYVKDWINNSMIFLEVEDTERYHTMLMELGLPENYKKVKISKIQDNDWGREFFLHDPSGILWHIGEFYK